MPSIGQTTRPGYVYDSATDTWIPIGIGPHTHVIPDVSNLQSQLDLKANATSVPSNVAGKNFLINGNFDFFQRQSFSTTTSGYGLDRWFQASSGSSSSVSVTQQTTGAPSGSRYVARITMGAGAGYGNQYQHIETSNVAALWGKTVTASIKLRRSSGFAGTLTVTLSKTATVDGGSAASWTPIASATATNAQLPTGTTSSDWYTIVFNATIPNDGTANTLQFAIIQSQTETNCYWEMSQAQLEIGSVATAFSRAAGTIAGELAACQRYYREMNTQFGYICSGTSVNSTDTVFALPMPSPMRVNPTLTVSANSDFDLIGSATRDVTSFNTVGGKNNFSVFDFYTTVASGQTAGHSATLFPDGANARFRLSAEL